jgi:hypothetical protein
MVDATLADLVMKLCWFAVVAVIWVLLYRAAFPPGFGEEPDGSPPPPGAAAMPTAAVPPVPPPAAVAGSRLIDARPRTRCPGCGEMVLVEARLCRFCGYRFAEPSSAEPQ